MLLATPITVHDLASALRDAALAAEHGAELVEFRVDGFFEWEASSMPTSIMQLQQLVSRSPLPCILTCRHASEGGGYDGPEDARVSMYEALCTSEESAPAYIDIELRAFQKSANIRQKLRLCVQHPGQLRDVRSKLILSLHDFAGFPPDLARSVAAMLDEPACSVIKVAARARNVLDALELLDTAQRGGKPSIMIAMGEFGSASRVLGGKFGSLLTFAPLSKEAATAPGQFTLAQLLNTFGVRRVRSTSRVYGIIGWPVAGSLSPLVHNAAFAREHEAASAQSPSRVYVHLPIAQHAASAQATTEDGGSDTAKAQALAAQASFAGFAATLSELIEHPHLHFCGASITMPHKQALAQLATAMGWECDAPSSALGAANTLIIERSFASDGTSRAVRIAAANTDALALRTLLAEHATSDVTAAGASRDVAHALAGKSVGVVGAGGVGAAAAWAAASCGAHVVIYNRTLEKAQALAAKIRLALPTQAGNVVAMPMSALERACCDVFVQCTSVGMQADAASHEKAHGAAVAAMPIPQMQACMPPHASSAPLLIETIYKPKETATLIAAREAGWRTLDGTALFVAQAQLQSERWLGHKPPVNLFQQLVNAS